MKFGACRFSPIPSSLISTLVFMSLMVIPHQVSLAQSQVIPDDTLGTENSLVVPIDAGNDRIKGGAIRNANLFHSFQDFSIPENRGVFFANPQGIESIFSRVTGDRSSDIFGTLGVSGTANLFFLNPNGILFGPNAQLDLQGSFLGTTATSFEFGDGLEFGTIDPGLPPLLDVQVVAPIGLRFSDESGDITNLGRLAIEGDLTLSANNLDLQGQVLAGGDMHLQAENTVKIRDSVSDPFIAAATDDLLIQGNESVDIFTLNHPDSGIFSGGDLTLRSANPVIGDSHFFSFGNFKIEELDGNFGSLVSPHDPIIRSLGDVEFLGFQGRSLHILAGGNITISSFVIITGPESNIEGSDFLKESVALSNGKIVEIDGSAEPTLDIRAGVEPDAIGLTGTTGLNLPFDILVPSPVITTPTPTSADINLGTVVFLPDRISGKVLVTNQYKPNSLLEGKIMLSFTRTTQGISGRAISVASGLGGGSVYLDSRGDIEIDGIVDASGFSVVPGVSDGGDITVLSNADILISERGSIASAGIAGGQIDIESKGQLMMEGNGSGNFNTDTSLIASITLGSDKGGDVNVSAQSILLKDTAEIFTGTTLNRVSSQTGSGGNLNVHVTNSIELLNGGLFTIVQSGTGSSGNIEIDTKKLIIQNTVPGSNIQNGVRISGIEGSSGRGGNIKINASESIEIIGNRPDAFVPDITQVGTFINSLSVQTGISTSPFDASTAGDVIIDTPKLVIRNGGGIAVVPLPGSLMKLVKGSAEI